MPQHSHGCEAPGGNHTRANGVTADSRLRGDCPHIDRNDSRCGHRFSLGRIEQAFGVCFGAFHGCPIYHRINGELHEQARCASDRVSPAKAAVAVITVSANGRGLRATGT